MIPAHATGCGLLEVTMFKNLELNTDNAPASGQLWADSGLTSSTERLSEDSGAKKYKEPSVTTATSLPPPKSQKRQDMWLMADEEHLRPSCGPLCAAFFSLRALHLDAFGERIGASILGKPGLCEIDIWHSLSCTHIQP